MPPDEALTRLRAKLQPGLSERALLSLLARDGGDASSVVLSAADEDLLLIELAAKAPGPCSMAKDPGHPGDNWVSEQGGLPNYACQIAKAVHRKGMPTSQAIAIAIGTIKRWAVDPSKSASVRARAAEAVAQWERMKASANAHHTVKAAHAAAS